MRWFIVASFVVVLIAVAMQEIEAQARRRRQTRVSELIRKGKRIATQISRSSSKTSNKRSWWRSPVSKIDASQKSARRALRKKAGSARKRQSISAKRKTSKRKSRKRGNTFRASARRKTKYKSNRRKESVSKVNSRRRGKHKGSTRKFPIESVYRKKSVRHSAKEDTRITKGLFTYRAEGDDNVFSRKFSRRARVLVRRGGVVIGRGYDLSRRHSKEIYDTMIKAGISEYTADKLAGAAGLTGQRAKSYIQEHLFDIVISRVQQRRLFKIMEQQLEQLLKKLFRYHILVKRFGKLNWNSLNRAIKEIVIDLRFKGEFMPPARRVILPSIVGNRLLEFTGHMRNRTLWQHVPRKRFELRANYLENECRKRYTPEELRMCYFYQYCKGRLL